MREAFARGRLPPQELKSAVEVQDCSAKAKQAKGGVVAKVHEYAAVDGF